MGFGSVAGERVATGFTPGYGHLLATGGPLWRSYGLLGSRGDAPISSWSWTASYVPIILTPHIGTAVSMISSIS